MIARFLIRLLFGYILLALLRFVERTFGGFAAVILALAVLALVLAVRFLPHLARIGAVTL